MLDIVIPTYNREALLSTSLANLLPQLNSHIRLLLLDNASTDRTQCIAEKVIKEYPDLSIAYVRNSVNIGGNANILRAFELSTSQWLWILGDDDAIEPNSLAVVQAAIDRHRNSLYIEFATKLNKNPPDSELVFNDLGLLFESKSFSFSNLLFISSGVYNAKLLQPYIRFGHHYQYTFAPHVCVLLIAVLELPRDIVLNPARIISWEPLQDSVWDHNFLSYSLLQVLNILPMLSLRRLLYSKIQDGHGIELRSSFSFGINLLCAPRRVIVDTIHVNLDIYRLTGFRGIYMLYLQIIYLLNLLGVGSLVSSALFAYRALRAKKSLALESPLGSRLRKFNRL